MMLFVVFVIIPQEGGAFGRHQPFVAVRRVEIAWADARLAAATQVEVDGTDGMRAVHHDEDGWIVRLDRGDESLHGDQHGWARLRGDTMH